MGVSAEQAGAALQKMSKILTDVSHTQAEIYKHDSDIVKINTTIGDLKNRLTQTEAELHDLRPDLDALIEISKQKTVLEKIEPIVEIKREPMFDTEELDEWYDNFMKELKIIL
jgi:uncharacterized coiled-coil DUF342 family protein